MDEIVKNLSDSKLIRVLQDYKKWVHTGELESGSGLSRLRDIYRDYYMESGVALMERAILRECAYRWLKIKQIDGDCRDRPKLRGNFADREG